MAETAGNPGESNAGEKKFIIASETDFPPFTYEDETSGEYTGFDIELIKAVAGELGWEYEIKSMFFQQIIPALGNSEVDLAVSALTIRDEFKERVKYSIPYYRSIQAVVVNSERGEVKALSDLDGKKVGVKAGTTGAVKARNLPGAEITEFTSIAEAFMALKNGEVQGVVTDFTAAAYFIKGGSSDIKVLQCLDGSEHFAIAVPAGNRDTLEAVNSALATLKEKGKYAKIYSKWFGEPPPEYLPGEPPWS